MDLNDVPDENSGEESDDRLSIPEQDDLEPPTKIFKRGIVYISFIPPGMSPTVLRNLLSSHAPVCRMYLQPANQKKGRRFQKRPGQVENYSEGWVEFLKKRHAKQIAALLNNQKIGGKKKSPFHEYLWNLKYLSKFKWVHLIERLNYERAVLKQRMTNEISQAKRVASHFKDAVDKEEAQRRRKKKLKGKSEAVDEGAGEGSSTGAVEKPERVFKQRETNEEIRTKKRKAASGEEKREQFLSSLFG